MAVIPLEPATPAFWERVAVSLAAQGENLSSWSEEAGVNIQTLSEQRARNKLPRPHHIDALCTLTGCTREFLFNPEPVDLSK